MSTPTLPTNHDEYEALAVAWAVNALEPADHAIFEAHLAGCKLCTRAASAALDVAAELAFAVPDAVPPARLRERVLAAAVSPSQAGHLSGRPSRTGIVSAARPESDAGAAREGQPRRQPKGPARGRIARGLRGPRRLVYALAAAVLVVGSAVTAWGITRPAPVIDRIAALNAGTRTVATVVVHQRGADVVTDVLPPNAGRRTAYYLWGVPAEDGGTPRVVGTFEVTTSGLHSYPLRLIRSLDGYPVLAVSEERAGSTPSTPSGVLGKGALGG